MTQDNLATFIDVILPLHLEGAFTYRVPVEMEHMVAIGKRVAIQFGARKVYSGLIYRIHAQPPKQYEAKYIFSVLDEFPVLKEEQLKFWEWIAQYYLCSIGEVMQAALPAALKLESATRIEANPDFLIQEIETDDKEFLIWEALEVQPTLTLAEISEIVRLKNVFPLIKSMVSKGMITIKEELKEKYKPKTISCIDLSEHYADETALANLFDTLEKQPKQLSLLMAYLHLKQQNQLIDKATLIQTAGVTASTLQTLIRKNIFSIREEAIDRLQINWMETESFLLNEGQQKCYDEIKEFWQEKEIVLLQGITGSGKTHVYVKLIEESLQQGKQVLFLLPEIALTSQIVKRLRKHFGDECISYHSKYNDSERVEIWQKVKEGVYKIIIGARSSVFLPFQQLGLVVVDEEHEPSYKQHEPAPRYHARDAALMLARLHGAKAILGSATPSLETWHMANTGKYGRVKLDSRYYEVALPSIETADLTEERRTKKMRSEDVGETLFTAIDQSLKKNQQSILFQNRRGYSPFLSCNTCGWVPRCKNCDISLTYHKYLDSLKCHYCGYTMAMPKACQTCESPALTLKGAGTEKVEDEVSELFKEARIARLDLDAAKTKHGHEEIIKGFEDRQFDILVGTQMVSKGLDFEHVSLVGVVNADSLLQFPDFRANERAMQLLMQVSGRAGRKHEQGKVIIQTTMPNHYVLQLLKQQKYEPLLERELEEREKFAYPPFFRLIKIVIKHKDYRIAEEASNKLKHLLEQHLKVIIMGPASPYVSKIRNLYIREILIKIKRNHPDTSSIKSAIKQCMKEVQQDKLYRQALIFADVDPG